MTKYLILIIGAVLVAASGSNAQMGSPLNNPDMACTIEGRCVNATSKCAINGVNKTGRDCLRCLPGDRIVETVPPTGVGDRKSTRLNSSHRTISYAVFCLK